MLVFTTTHGRYSPHLGANPKNFIYLTGYPTFFCVQSIMLTALTLLVGRLLSNLKARIGLAFAQFKGTH